MATFQDILDTVRAEAHLTEAELPDADALLLFKGGIRDLDQVGVLNDQAIATISWVTGTYAYAVPASFIWIHHLERESETVADSYDEWIPGWNWDIANVAGTPTFEFNRGSFTPQPTNTKKIRVIGQSKLTVPTALADTVLSTIEGITQELFRVRALSRASMGQSELAVDRANQRREEKVIYQETLAGVVASRVLPSSRRVVGR